MFILRMAAGCFNDLTTENLRIVENVRFVVEIFVCNQNAEAIIFFIRFHKLNTLYVFKHRPHACAFTR